MAKKLEVPSCCGAFPLRTGTIIIAVIQIIIFMLMVILTYAIDIRWEEALPGTDRTTAKIVYTISFCITIFIAILLLVGVFQRNSCLMLPWLTIGVIGLVMTLINIIVSIAASIMNDDPKSCYAVFIGGGLTLGMHTHLWRVVYSHYKELKKDKTDNYPQQA